MPLPDPNADSEMKVAAGAAKIADTRQRNGDQPVQEFIHPGLAQGHLHPDIHAFAQLECRDRLARLGDHRLLTGNLRHVIEH